MLKIQGFFLSLKSGKYITDQWCWRNGATDTRNLVITIFLFCFFLRKHYCHVLQLSILHLPAMEEKNTVDKKVRSFALHRYLSLPTQSCTASTVTAMTMDHVRNIVAMSHQQLQMRSVLPTGLLDSLKTRTTQTKNQQQQQKNHDDTDDTVNPQTSRVHFLQF